MGSKFILHLKLFRLIWDSEKYKICKVNVLTRNFVHRRFILFLEKGCTQSDIYNHYGRTVIPRVPGTSPRAKNRALGEANLPRVLHSGKISTRGRGHFPSVAKAMALRESSALGESHLPREEHSGKGGTRKMNLGFDGDGGRNSLQKNGKHLPRVLATSTREETSSPSALSLALGEGIFICLFFCPIFFRPSHIILTPYQNLTYFWIFLLYFVSFFFFLNF
jgi:hypothetical protein